MRTTLDIDDDVLFAAKELAAKEKSTAGRILSEYFRRGLNAPSATTRSRKPGRDEYEVKNGFPVLPAQGRIITPELVRRLMEEEQGT